MSNLIQYIVQDDPEELKKQNVNKKNYFFTSREQQEECRYNPYNLIENGRKSLTQDKAQTKEPSNIKADLLSEQVGNDAASYKIVPNTKGNITENAKAKANNIDYSLYGDGFSKEFIDEMLSNEDYQRALKEYAIPNEGGYVNNPQDPGE